jgi:hypothetical protein
MKNQPVVTGSYYRVFNDHNGLTYYDDPSLSMEDCVTKAKFLLKDKKNTNINIKKIIEISEVVKTFK